MFTHIKTFCSLSFVLSFCTCGSQATPSVSLEPTGMLYACPGESLEVNCSTNADLMIWSIKFPLQQMPQRIRSFQAGGQLTTFSRTINFTNLNISVVGNMPLIAILSANNLTAHLNGSSIICSGRESSASVEIMLIKEIVKFTSSINITSKQFEVHSAIIAFDWTTENGVHYSISIHPSVAINFTRKNSAEVALSYNIKYNVSVIETLCGRSETTFTIIHHAKCFLPTFDASSSIHLNGFSSPALEGTRISFGCPPELVLTGPTSSTCMENGEWEPVLTDTMCKIDCGIPIVSVNVSANYHSTLEDSLLTFQCQNGLLPDNVFGARCSRNGSWIPNPSSHVCTTELEGSNSMDTDLLTAISGSLGSLLALVLAVCIGGILVMVVVSRRKGYFIERRSFQEGRQVGVSMIPEYEEVIVSASRGNPSGEQDDVEMMKNAAYGPTQLSKHKIAKSSV